jgi:hypothetical protein
MHTPQGDASDRSTRPSYASDNSRQKTTSQSSFAPQSASPSATSQQATPVYSPPPARGNPVYNNNVHDGPASLSSGEGLYKKAFKEASDRRLARILGGNSGDGPSASSAFAPVVKAPSVSKLATPAVSPVAPVSVSATSPATNANSMYTTQSDVPTDYLITAQTSNVSPPTTGDASTDMLQTSASVNEPGIIRLPDSNPEPSQPTSATAGVSSPLTNQPSAPQNTAPLRSPWGSSAVTVPSIPVASRPATGQGQGGSKPRNPLSSPLKSFLPK